VDDPVYSLTRPSTLVEDDEGTLYSVHPSDQEIRIWTAEGEARGSLGGPGEGPGEFQRPAGLGFHGDSLWVFDRRLYRTTWFGPDGELLGVESPDVNLGGRDGPPPPRPARPLRDGSYLARPTAFSSLVASGELTEGAWVRTTAEGELLDTVFVQGFGRNGLLAIEREAGGTYSSQPFADDELPALHPDGGMVVLSRPAAAEEPARGRVEVVRVAANGDTAWVRTLDFGVTPVTAARADSAADAIAERLHEWIGQRTGQSLPAMRNAVGDALYRPPHTPAVRQVAVGRDGSVWLALDPGATLAGVPEAGEGGGTRWVVLDARGEDRGTTTLPDGFTLLDADEARVLGVETDELDVPYIVRYELEAGG
jgi:hypothetical protein